MVTIKGKYTNAEVMADKIDDEESEKQIKQIINHPAFTGKTVFMPDFHAGAGAVIGTTTEFNGEKIIPNTVGVDVGCGVLTQEIPINTLPKSLSKLDKKIREHIPMGRYIRSNPYYDIENKFPWLDTTSKLLNSIISFREKFNSPFNPIVYDHDWFLDTCESVGIKINVAMNSLGTLGGGNHFIEVGKTDNDRVFISIHSGSRQFGLRICNFWQKTPIEYLKERAKDLLKDEIAKIKSEYLKDNPEKIPEKIDEVRKELRINETLSGDEYIEGDDMKGYLTDMVFAQAYAQENRRIMMKIIMDILNIEPTVVQNYPSFETIHNYINFNDWIIRKGAVSAHNGEMLVIPFNMEDGILLCEGKGNADWNFSAPHGAGRVLSRKKAKEILNSSDAERRMKKNGIFTSSIPVDEMKEAYKDSEVIEKAIEPTVRVVDKFKPLINIKAEG